MKYKCIKDVIVDGNKVINKSNIIEVSEDKKQLYNITTGVDIKNVDIDTIIQYHLENITDNCTCDKPVDSRHPFQVITDNMFKIYCKKNKDYGNSFDRSLDKWGLSVAAIRLGDKLNRFESYIKNGSFAVNDEGVRDTLMDLATYAIMTVMRLDKNMRND